MVTNNLPEEPSNVDTVTCEVSRISTATHKIITNVELENGRHTLAGTCISPDGKHAFVTEVLGRFHITTDKIEQGWIHSNEPAVIDLNARELKNTVILDDISRGAENPQKITCSADGQKLPVPFPVLTN
ncbi:MAG: hypothetical protein GF344_15360 [Chitinivibrionales bacterium]|nr:hypothetical protein [Chitinivibrionales bacterium]MBD3358084.1 hypothetical protein [Chitinivibrionales bacterium]